MNEEIETTEQIFKDPSCPETIKPRGIIHFSLSLSLENRRDIVFATIPSIWLPLSFQYLPFSHKRIISPCSYICSI